jgi:hypothetical protein
MGYFKNIHLEILDYKARGRSIEDTYIYFKDYIEMEDLVGVWEGEHDQDPVEAA